MGKLNFHGYLISQFSPTCENFMHVKTAAVFESHISVCLQQTPN